MDYSKFGETDKKKVEKSKKRGGQEGGGRRRKKTKRRRERRRRRIDRVLLTCLEDRVVDGRMDSPCQVRKGGGFQKKKKKLMVGTDRRR